jgi:16S rRNA (uracil1498-N3)-methyltransferase
MSFNRFHVPEVAPGARVALPEHTAHHAREVLRLRAGMPVRLFDGAGREYDAVLDAVSRREVTAHVTGIAEARPESPLRLVLALSALKGDRMELVIQKVTELGVSEVWPLVTARTDSAARPALAGARHERWEKVASGAAEQCGRAVVPQISPTLTFEALLATPFDGIRLLLAAGEGTRPLSSSAVPRGVLLLVGPPGGFEEHEMTRARAAGFEVLRLGPRILRSETAAIAAVTAAQLLYGDLSA